MMNALINRRQHKTQTAAAAAAAAAAVATAAAAGPTRLFFDLKPWFAAKI
jgi:hypothetical protein